MVTNRKLELLVPAKDKETAICAIEYGADAVYIGAENFGARKAAGNSLAEIKEVIDYAHKFYVKVHITINTILNDEELEQAKKLIHGLYEIGADAIIVQDMGILELAAKGELPPIPIHTSTQCDTRTLEKAEFFQTLGVSRIILARELSLNDIAKICEKVSAKEDRENAAEVEVFIHGALCVSYSGQCFMSAYIGGRSANRGECAQACRKKYTLTDENNNIIAKDKYLLNLKDFNASKYLDKLVKAGVKSFKIEGRLKDINYVKNVTLYYRNILDKLGRKSSSGKIFADFEPDVNKSFNRGFTEYFLKKREHCYNFDTPKSTGEKIGKVTSTGKDFFEIKTKLKISPQDGLCFMNGGHLEGCLVNRVDDKNKRIYPNRMNGIKTGTEIFRNQDVNFEKLLENSKTKRQIGLEIIYKDRIIKAVDDDKNYVEIPIEYNETAKNSEKMKDTFIKQTEKTGGSDYYIRKIKILSELPFIPVSAINDLRRKIFEKMTAERLKNYKREYQKPLDYSLFPVEKVDYTANIHNKTAKEFYKKCGCEVCEMSFESKNYKSYPVELMRTKHCLKYAFDMCKSPEKLFLKDEKGKVFLLKFDCKNCEMVILES